MILHKSMLITLSILCLNSYGATSQYKLDQNQILKLGNGAEPKELDPSTSTGVPESHIVDNIFEGLTTLDPFTQDAAPGVAQSWDVSADGKTYTFHLRKNAKWSDGVTIKAEDFVWSWIRALSPQTASEYAYQLYYIKNGEAFNRNKLKDPSLLGVKAKDDYTLVVTLENPTPYFLRLTSFHTLYPTPRHVISKYPGKAWTKQDKIVSNGPFMLKEWKLNQHIRVVRNPHYWDAKNMIMDEVYFYPIENTDTEEKTFKAGDLHMTSSVPIIKIPYYKKRSARLKKKNKYNEFKLNPYLGTYYYRFNVTRTPTNDVRVRRALALTVDRKLIVERITRGGQLPATHFTPDVAGYSFDKQLLPASVTPQAIAEAKKLLKEAGYPNGKGMPTIQILYNTAEAHKKIAIAIQQMWKKHLGINVELFNQEWKVYLNSQHKLDYWISRSGWIGDYLDPNTFLNMFVTNGGNNQTGWSHKEYDRLIRRAEETRDQKERYAIFQQAEEILMQDLPVLPLYLYTQARLVSAKVKLLDDNRNIIEWQSNILDRWILKNYAIVR